MSGTSAPETTQAIRRGRLDAFVREENPEEIYDDRTATALAGGEVPRYVLVTFEGSAESSYRSNPDITVYDNLDALASGIVGSSSEGWTPWRALDLDTGKEVGWTFTLTFDEETVANV